MKTSKIVVGSSNLYRHFGSVGEKLGFTMMNCTTIEIFRVRMASLEDEDREVVLSVIENFICDGVKTIDLTDLERAAPDIDKAIENAIDSFIEVVKETIQRLKKTRVAMADLSMTCIHHDTIK